tara:strand:+ start:1830 stop:2216 length:387 start_codon:yes stop_codon:yes gene_type:complete
MSKFLISNCLRFLQKHWLSITLFNLLMITALSLWPVDQLPEVPGSDKTHHLLAYALLMFPAALAHPRRWLLHGLFFIGWSGAIELIQPHMNRYGEWADMAANIAGVVMGYSLAWLSARCIPRLDLSKD